MNTEPVRIAALVRAVILCATAFGLGWTAEQIAAVMVVVEIAGSIVVRRRVWSEQSVIEVL